MKLSTAVLALVVPALPCAAQSLVRTLNGPAANVQFGKACVSVPDTNGDGYEDVVVGAPGYNQQRGAIYCVSGAFLANGTGASILWTLAPPANQSDLFGAALADVGDVTGDGVHDFLVGQPGYDTSTVNDMGAVRLVNGASHAISSLTYGAIQGGLFGAAIAACGDLILDGKSEVLIGAPGTSSTTSAVYLLVGSMLSSSGSIHSLNTGELYFSTGEQAGTSVASNFNLADNGPSRTSDFVIGVPGFDGAVGADSGKILFGRIVFGGSGSTISVQANYVGASAGERLGASVDAAHDYDGDGRADLLVGAPNSPNGTMFEVGRFVAVSSARLLAQTSPFDIFSASFGSPLPPVNHSDPEPDYHFGAAVKACADLNNDGVGEIIVGAPGYFTQGLSSWYFRGAVRIYSGASGALFAGISGSTTDRLGDVLGGAIADLDGDGFEEFLLAGSLSDAGGTDSGVLKCYRLFPLAPSTYCTGKLNSLGCTPGISSSGTPSASSIAPFAITATSFINQKNGLLFYSHAPTSVLFQGGTKCVMNPTVRTPPQSSGGSASGNDCTGAYSFDFNAWMVNGWDSTLVAGSEVYAQFWSRDPQTPSHTSLSNALRFVINP
jgi:hypothetical protein